MFTLLLEISTPERAHENMVQYVDVLLCSSHVCVVMEPLVGPELFEWLEEAWSQMSEEKLRDLMKQMLAAIRFTHESGLIHRDVKITAFRFRTAHAAAPLVLFDYGLCCVSASAPRARAIVGTPEYIAPEMGLGVYDAKVDVWSVAVCFYAMLVTAFLVEYDLEGSDQRVDPHRDARRARRARSKKEALDYAISPSAVSFTKRLLAFEPASRPAPPRRTTSFAMTTRGVAIAVPDAREVRIVPGRARQGVPRAAAATRAGCPRRGPTTRTPSGRFRRGRCFRANLGAQTVPAGFKCRSCMTSEVPNREES